MINFSALRHFNMSGASLNSGVTHFEFVITAMSFLIGLIAGSIIGVFSDDLLSVLQSLTFFTSYDGSFGMSRVFRSSLLFLALAALFSTGFLGVIFLPLLAFFRGFFLSCSAALFFSGPRFSGFFPAVLSVGIPALFSVPAFVLLVCAGFRFSQRMLPWRLTKYHVSTDVSFDFRLLFFIFFLMLFEALYCQFLLPYLQAHLN